MFVSSLRATPCFFSSSSEGVKINDDSAVRNLKRNIHTRWEENNEENLNHHHQLHNTHRSTIGSISAAVAVRSIQEPLNINNNNIVYNLNKKEYEERVFKEIVASSPARSTYKVSSSYPSQETQQRIIYGRSNYLFTLVWRG
ncbi:unnamed protein product [Lepeophtheirus salmonis]|uniref:(salmon louse) hypothetical protein n=1 Tax=Lepeophtheirus salmonis TaxID=72036 RepID=A0A7R8CXD1_LEPSM|nr:unnamed protein product [Lepeophtheirus salmonis]CAF2959107.1 unnamed protein product [Lepeophtheirus salmonis]